MRGEERREGRRRLTGAVGYEAVGRGEEVGDGERRAEQGTTGRSCVDDELVPATSSGGAVGEVRRRGRQRAGAPGRRRGAGGGANWAASGASSVRPPTQNGEERERERGSGRVGGVRVRIGFGWG